MGGVLPTSGAWVPIAPTRPPLGHVAPSTARPVPAPSADFDGATFEREHDRDRLSRQLERVKRAVSDGRWRTLAELAGLVGAPQASVSARLRDLRKLRFGAHRIERRPRGSRRAGVFEYRLAHGPAAITDAVESHEERRYRVAAEF